MGKVLHIRTAGGREPDSLALAQQVDELVRVVDGNIEFGEPQNPLDISDAGLAGDFALADAHQGTPLNIAGSWVEIALEVVGLTTATCTHNLYLQDNAYVLPVTSQPNCRWLQFGVMHDGTPSQPASSRLGVDVFYFGDAVTTNSIDLRFNLRVMGIRPTIGSSNPVLVTLFFTKATRGE